MMAITDVLQLANIAGPRVLALHRLGGPAGAGSRGRRPAARRRPRPRRLYVVVAQTIRSLPIRSSLRQGSVGVVTVAPSTRQAIAVLRLGASPSVKTQTVDANRSGVSRRLQILGSGRAETIGRTAETLRHRFRQAAPDARQRP